MTWNAEEWLKKQHTRELLKLLDRTRKFGGYYDISENHQGFCITDSQIKAILATREHIPNKKETRERRQKIAKNKKNR